MTSVPKLTQSEVNVRRASRSNSRKISNPAETIHASSERDEKPVAHTEPAKSVAKSDSNADVDSMSLAQLINRLSTIVVVFELRKVNIDVCGVMLRRSSKDLHVEYTTIRLSRLRIKSSNGDEVVQGNIRNLINVNKEVEQCYWLMEANDFSVDFHLPSKTADIIVSPMRTTVALSLSHKPTNETKKKNEDELDSKKSDQVVDPQLSSTYSINVHVDMSPINIFGRHVSR